MIVNGSFASYATYYFRKFAIFLDSTHLCDDDHIEKFLIAMGRKYNYKPHHKKFGLAALSHLLKLAVVPNFLILHICGPRQPVSSWLGKHFWSKIPVSRLIRVFSRNMNFICGLTSDNTGELTDLVIVYTCNWIDTCRATSNQKLLQQFISPKRLQWGVVLRPFLICHFLYITRYFSEGGI
jgi:hypothetical protein